MYVSEYVTPNIWTQNGFNPLIISCSQYDCRRPTEAIKAVKYLTLCTFVIGDVLTESDYACPEGGVGEGGVS
jgi:hypothetical protein